MSISCDRFARKGLAAILLIVLVVAAGFLAPPADGAQASTGMASLAPVSSDFSRSLADRALNRPLRTPDGRGLGELPSPLDFSSVRGMQVPVSMLVAPPASYDLRSLGRVSSVKNQLSYGTCWSFASYGSLESCLLTRESSDFSEDNLVLKSGFGAIGATASSLYNMGGNINMSTAYLARWGGPVYETADAYGDGYTPAGLTPAKHVQEVDWIPPRSSALDNDNVKNAVMAYGGVYAGMGFYGSSSGSTYYKASTASYYYNGSSGSNHGVLIVGWDDNYPRTNFATLPAGNGAFLVKNSWGTSWGSAGYFYVSYYDAQFGRTSALAVFDGAESTSNYTGIYQYDPLGEVGSMYSGSGGGTGWFANVFAAQTTSSLSAVGFYTLYPNTSYEVYAGSSLTNLSLRTTGTQAYMGYHTVALPASVAITSGQRFAVAVKVVTAASAGTTYYPIALEYPVSGYSAAATASAGQSYVSANGTTWSDVTTAVVANGNVCLKAFTGASLPSTYTLGTSVTGSGSITRNPDQSSYTAGSTVTLTAVPNAGYTFSGWSGDASGNTNPLPVTMSANKNIAATFAPASSTTRFEQTNAYLAYAGTWSSGTGSYYSGTSYKYTNASNASVTIKFAGSAISYVAKTASTYGQAKVTLDGGTPQYVDLYSATTKYKVNVWSAASLGAGTHTLVIAWSGTRGTGTGYSVDLDAVDIAGGALVDANGGGGSGVTRFEQSNALLAYAGYWTTASSTYYSGSSYALASRTGATLTAKFTGTAISYIAKTASSLGMAKVTLDGGTPQYVDLYSATNKYKVSVWTATALSQGTHTLVIEYSGTRGGGSGYTINLDALDITGGSLVSG